MFLNETKILKTNFRGISQKYSFLMVVNRFVFDCFFLSFGGWGRLFPLFSAVDVAREKAGRACRALA
ncbi:MAG TPA: hypothetical protein VKZ97_05685 [Flavobacteriaceae bacterium]|nr:hypothetical protein [Flavobacteriaceae bacterium]